MKSDGIGTARFRMLQGVAIHSQQMCRTVNRIGIFLRQNAFINLLAGIFGQRSGRGDLCLA